MAKLAPHEVFPYLDGVVDGLTSGVNVGFRVGAAVGVARGYTAGHGDGYVDGYLDAQRGRPPLPAYRGEILQLGGSCPALKPSLSPLQEEVQRMIEDSRKISETVQARRMREWQETQERINDVLSRPRRSSDDDD